MTGSGRPVFMSSGNKKVTSGPREEFRTSRLQVGVGVEGPDPLLNETKDSVGSSRQQSFPEQMRSYQSSTDFKEFGQNPSGGS